MAVIIATVTTLLGVRFWELGVFLGWLVCLIPVLRFGSPLLTGVYVGATLTIFWDWICGSPWLFNIPHYDHRFLHLFTIQGRMEPIWVAFAQGPFFGLPALLLLKSAWLRRQPKLLAYVGIGVAFGLSDYIVEGISVGTLHLYTYTYHSSSLFVGVPWEVLFVYVPVCIAVTLFLVERTARLLRLAGTEPGLGAAAITTVAVSLTPAPAARITLGDRRIGFWLGVAIPITALYPGAWALALLNQIIHPLALGH